MTIEWEEPPSGSTTIAVMREFKDELRLHPGQWGRCVDWAGTKSSAMQHATKMRKAGFLAASRELDDGDWGLWACWPNSNGNGDHAS